MRAEIIQRVTTQAPGPPDQPWETVIAAAERDPAARIPGSLRHDHQPKTDPRIPDPIAPAAVLVAIIEREHGMSVLLTRRTDKLARHAGQISFPGGRADPEDDTPVKTALREAREEVGLAEDHVEIAGRLDNYLVGTGYRVTPVVGLVSGAPEFSQDMHEVAEIFEVPLAHVLDPANYRRDEVVVKGFHRKFHVLDYQDYFIWGATAAMLVNLRDVLRAPC
jgi:8-oxo-dGTP pyrophosphatase MutT (NUDIX family)